MSTQSIKRVRLDATTDLVYVLPAVAAMLARKSTPEELRAEATQQLQDGVSRLEKGCPVSSLDAAGFKAMLTMAVTADRLVQGRLKTKTSIELSGWLDVLEGKKTREQFNEEHPSLWTWPALLELRVSPLLAFCYMRMVREAGQATI